MKPRIGITPSPSTDDLGYATFYRFALSDTYVRSVIAAGGIPVILPTIVEDVEESLHGLDGLILSGGGDIDPARFGDTDVHHNTYGIDDPRDQYEIAAYTIARQRDLPVLCICRGIQVMNVVVGGDLFQDVTDQIPNSIIHRQTELGKTRDDTSHTVTFESGENPVREIAGKDSIETNSYHHQSIRNVAPELRLAATTSDGVVEALWDPQMRFGIGVQWHPEMLAAHRPEHAAYFQALVTAAWLVTVP
ncbi:MAG: gamma-glutamyl-gamma-aminobutyrate hydrolase family protein [Thermomicrobiales bacterium]